MIIVVDFGSQTAHLIQRRIKEFGVETKLISPEEILRFTQNDKGVKGIVLSGGPSSVYVKNAPNIDPKIFSLNIPVLGICYGLQIMAKLLGGKVVSGKKEYGPATLKLRIMNNESIITKDLPKSSVVWMSHGDEVLNLPNDFEILGSTDSVNCAFVGDLKRNIFGLQFHPEVEHTEFGLNLLKNFIKICDLETYSEFQTKVKNQKSKIKITNQKSKLHYINVDQIIKNIKHQVEGTCVIGAVSGGVDSTVAATITAKAIGKKFVPVYVDNGLMREGTTKHVKKIFLKLGIKPKIVNVKSEMLKRLKGVDNPEKKRKIIGKFYIEIFEKEMKKLIKEGKDVKFLLQGTIYSDVIESKGTRHASKIKSHHNVGGLPKNMKLQLIEPLRQFYKDEVRLIGRSLGLPSEFVDKQVFPGPGYAIRIRGEVTKKRLEKEKKADKIVLEELEKAGILPNVYMSFPILTGASSTAVKGDGRFFGEVVAIRIIESKDVMTSHWSRVPYDTLQKISSRIVNEIPEISRVVYDITTKPPATMEWE